MRIKVGVSSHIPSALSACKSLTLLWFIEGKQSTEKPGGAHCGESRMMRFEWECQRATSGSTPNDSVVEEFGELFRVWNRRTLLGTFYETSEGWKVEPFYLCKQYIKAEKDLSQSVGDAESAIAYIKSMYEGAVGDLTPEKIHPIAA